MPVEVQMDVPDAVHQRIAEISEQLGLSVEQFVTAAINERVDRLAGLDALRRDAAQAIDADFRRCLELIPSNLVDPMDEIPTVGSDRPD